MRPNITELNKEIEVCQKCARLAEYIRRVAKNKVKRFESETYWGRPLTGFGDIKAQLLIVGLAPAAHGGNRTGRMFTGDSSGDWLARALFENGFASKPSSISSNDGLILKNAYITAAVRCAPPKNKPNREEMNNCFKHLEKEFSILTRVQIIVCLGQIAYETTCRLLGMKKGKFAHNSIFSYDKYKIITSYHPSRQNTQTSRLVWADWTKVFQRAKILLK